MNKLLLAVILLLFSGCEDLEPPERALTADEQKACDPVLISTTPENVKLYKVYEHCKLLGLHSIYYTVAPPEVKSSVVPSDN